MALVKSSPGIIRNLKLNYAPDAWRLLNGVFCLHKPTNVSMERLKYMIVTNLCRDLNLMEVRPPMKNVKIEGSINDNALTVTNVCNLTDTPEVLGPRYQIPDFKISWLTNLHKFASGLCVIGINDGCKSIYKFKQERHVRRFEVKGQFGYATDNFDYSGKIIEKTTYDHIKRPHIDRILASWQAAHQKQMFNYAGVDPGSQAAYELAVSGPIRPNTDSATIIYGLKCTAYNPPNFTIEIQCINEDQTYLMELVHDLGLDLKSTAVCTKLRQIDYGKFSIDLALLRKHWTVEHIIDNIARCAPLLSENVVLMKQCVKQE